MDAPPAPPDTSLRLPRSWLNTDPDGEAYWPTAAHYLADLRACVNDYERKARRRQRLTFDEARNLRRLLACLADAQAGREELSTADRTILEDAGGRLRQALAALAKQDHRRDERTAPAVSPAGTTHPIRGTGCGMRR